MNVEPLNLGLLSFFFFFFFFLIAVWLIWVSLVAQIGEGNGTPLQYSCLANPMDGGLVGCEELDTTE